MGQHNRVKYMQRGSGQVFYLSHDAKSGDWMIEMFVGGPDGIQPIGSWPSQAEAVEKLREMDCKEMHTSP